jgi:hypothetical protein
LVAIAVLNFGISGVIVSKHEARMALHESFGGHTHQLSFQGTPKPQNPIP